METRAHHLLIGCFVILLIAIGVAFAIWVAKVEVDREFKAYDIYFTEAVSGLSTGNTVRFKGVPVGSVKRIAIDRKDPSRIKVRIEVDANVPITEDTVAVLEALGLTGVAFVQLDGGAADSPPIQKKPDEEVPVIPSRPSAIQEVFSGAPDLVNTATLAVSRISQLLNPENQRQIAEILSNVNTFSAGLADSTNDVKSIIANLNDTLEDFRGAARAINRMSGAAESFLAEDAKQVMDEAARTVEQAAALTRDLREMVAENRAGIQNFTATGLPEAIRLLSDLREFARAATAIAQRLEEDPGALLSSKKVPEYEGTP
ncbi:MAG: MCE family protein [Alphaproteobacteria bacterium]|nr:MAG: MCE family protein [Alphaproteobacteria bacterium]